MKCWSRNDPLFAAIVLNSSTPHTFSVFKYFALALLCPRESWSPTSTASPSVSPSVSPKTCSAECALCAQVHTAVYSPPHTIQTLRMHPCTAAAESSTTPTQYCAMTAKQPSPAAPHTAAHPRPSPCTRILTHVIRIPNTVSLAYSTQDKPVTVPSRYYIWSVSEIARLLYTRVPPCPRKSSCPKYVQSYHHPFAAATPWPVPCP